MSNTIHAFDFLQRPPAGALAPVCAVFGDEAFLTSLVVQHLRRVVLGDTGVPPAVFDGASARWSDVWDEVSTVSLFGDGGRLAVVEDADPFVSRYRQELENYVPKPARGGTLLLVVRQWASNTRLYKLVDESGLQIDCRLPHRQAGKTKYPDLGAVARWLSRWASDQRGVQLPAGAAEELIELVGPQLGLLDQELARLALFVKPGEKISADLIKKHAGGWRAKTAWDLIEHAVDGRAADALALLDRLLLSGENPIALLGQLSWSLRRFAAAARLIERDERSGRGVNLPAALEEAGFRKWPREALVAAERQLKQLSRHRAGKLYRWLLELDLALKGSHSSDGRARLALEQLIFRLSTHAAPARSAAASPVSAAGR